MQKVLLTIAREYRSTALNKWFVFGVIAMPILVSIGMVVAIAFGILTTVNPPLIGTIAIIDRTEGQQVAARINRFYEVMQRNAQEPGASDEIEQALDTALERYVPFDVGERGRGVLMDVFTRQTQVDAQSDITVEVLPPDEPTDVHKQRLQEGDAIALIEIDDDTLRVARDASSYGLWYRPSMPTLHLRDMRRTIVQSIYRVRLEQAGIDPGTVYDLRDSFMAFPRARSATIDEEGEEAGGSRLNQALPFAFMFLLYLSSVLAGNYLLMSTLEEKSSRVMEVMLSAINPTQLLIAKVIGQGLVGLTVLGFYTGLGIVGMTSAGAIGLLPFELLQWLLIWFLLAYFFFAALMAALGSAVSEIREAQPLMMPVVIFMFLPFILLPAVTTDPDGMIARVMSHFPPTTPYVMTMRMGAPDANIPAWELATTLFMGVLGVVLVTLAAARIFRVGVLSYGKPPGFFTLIKWAVKG